MHREMSAETLLDLDIFNLSSDKAKKGGSGSDRRSDGEEEEDLEDNAPLLWQPGKHGYYSPRPGKNTPERLNAFRNIGRQVDLHYFIQHFDAVIWKSELHPLDVPGYASILFESKIIPENVL